MAVRIVASLLKWVGTLFFVGLFYLVINTFLIHPVMLQNSAMEPTFGMGDVVFIRKPAYGFTRHSFPVDIGLGDQRFLFTLPKRGDVVAFLADPKKPFPGEETQTYHVRRIVGLPGETIAVQGGTVLINGQQVSQFQDLAYQVAHDNNPYFKYTEQYQDGLMHPVLRLNDALKMDMPPVTIPEGYYFVMADNRDTGIDSRHAAVGLVPLDRIVGQVKVVFFRVVLPRDQLWNLTRWPKSLDRERILVNVTNGLKPNAVTHELEDVPLVSH